MACSKPFRLQSKYVFLTYPRCSTGKESALRRLKDRFEERLLWAVVCAERHKDGTPHLHVVCAHATRFDAKTSTYWDFVGGQHGSYEPVRNLRAALTYVTKGTRDNLVIRTNVVGVIEYRISVQEFLRLRAGSGGSTYAAIASRLRGGSSIHDMNEENCGFVLQNLRKLQDYVKFLEDDEERAVEDAKPRTMACHQLLWDHDITIMAWLQENVYNPRSLGAENLWIAGPTGIGKTRLKEQLMKYCRVYEPGYDSEWFDDYEDGKYDLVVFDEFKGQYKPTMMNRWLGSEWTTLRRRATNPIKKRDRLPCIVLSNYDIRDCYHNLAVESPQLEALERRVKVVKIEQRINITFK